MVHPLSFNETKLNNTIIDIVETIFYNATSVSRNVGSDGGGALLDIQGYDITYYNISEVDSAFDLRVNFTDITEFTTLIIRHKTEEEGGHTSAIQIWDYSDLAWEGYGLLTESETAVIKTLGVYDSSDHVGTGDDLGIVQVRVYQPASTPPKTHKHSFDWIAISKGHGTPVGQEIDPLSIHKTAINKSQFYYDEELNLNLTLVATKNYVDIFANTAATVYLSAVQDIQTATPTLVEFDTEEFDVGNNFNTGTYKYIVPSDGKYMVSLSIRSNEVMAVGKIILAYVYVGAVNVMLYQSSVATGGSAKPQIVGSKIIACSEDDEITLRFYHNQGANMGIFSSATRTYMSIVRVA